MLFSSALAFWAQNRDIHPLEGQNRSGHGSWKLEAGSGRLAAFMSNVLCIATWVQFLLVATTSMMNIYIMTNLHTMHTSRSSGSFRWNAVGRRLTISQPKPSRSIA